MSGAMIVNVLLRADEAVIAQVPVASIKIGRLPDGTQPPALLVRTVSSVDRQPLKRGGWVRRTDRIAVTVRAGSYRDQAAIIRLINSVCPGVKGDVLPDAKRVSILAAGVGPDVSGPGNSYEQTHDFRVSYDAPTTAPQAGG